MNKMALAAVLPPLAIAKYGGRAAWCAAPIATVWMSALVGIAIGLNGDVAGSTQGPSHWVLAFGLFVWAVSSIWAVMVIRGVESDAAHTPDSTADRLAARADDDTDPLDQIRGLR